MEKKNKTISIKQDETKMKEDSPELALLLNEIKSKTQTLSRQRFSLSIVFIRISVFSDGFSSVPIFVCCATSRCRSTDSRLKMIPTWIHVSRPHSNLKNTERCFFSHDLSFSRFFDQLFMIICICLSFISVNHSFIDGKYSQQIRSFKVASPFFSVMSYIIMTNWTSWDRAWTITFQEIWYRLRSL